MQRRILRQHGFAPSLDNLRRYWSIRSYYEDDDEIMQSVIYLRYAHLLKDCPLDLGSLVPNCSLVALDGTTTSLNQYATNNQQLVILAGSIT